MASTSMEISSKINGRAQLYKKNPMSFKMIQEDENKSPREPNITLQWMILQENSMDGS